MNLPKTLVLIGLVFVLVGGFLWLSHKIPFVNRLGRLPGDIRIERENFTFYFPLVTGLIISIVLTLVFQLLGRK